ncbi:MAG: acyltransferase, partial [Pseudomonadota bacterium]
MFFEQGDYGAESALLQPFLHMWSLAIEEQFYVVFPLAFLLISRTRLVGCLLCGALLAGLAISHATTEWHQALSFFSPVSRAWELLAGSVLAWAALRHPTLLKDLPGSRLIPALGGVLIIWPIMTAELSQAAHPGLETLPVVIGTCLVIWFANPRDLVTRALSTRPMISIGLLSYSLYLWHYPIFAFGRHIRLAEPGILDMAIWLALTVTLSYAGYRLVERPFRHAVPPRIFAGSIAVSTLSVVTFSAFMIQNSGYPTRFGALAEIYAENEFDNTVLRDQSWSVLDGLAENERIGGWNAQEPSRYEIDALWFSGEAETNVLLVGNSHSKDLFNALYLNKEAFSGIEFARFTIGTEVLDEQADLLFETPNFRAADVVILASRYHETPMDKIEDL